MPRDPLKDPTGKYPGRTIQVVSDKLDAKTVAAVAYQAGFRGKLWTIAVAVSFAENGSHDASAQHLNQDKSVDVGLWQINTVHGLGIRPMFEPQRNADAAYNISSKGTDFSPWSTYPVLSGAQMPKAQATIYDLVHNHGGAVEWLKNNPIGTPSDVKGSVDSPNVGDQIANSGPIGAISNALGFLTDSHNWFRAGEIVGGAIILLLGLYVMVKGSGVPLPA